MECEQAGWCTGVCVRAQRTVQAQPCLQAQRVPGAKPTQAHFWVVYQLLSNLQRPVSGDRELKAVLTGVPADTADDMLSAIQLPNQ